MKGIAVCAAVLLCAQVANADGYQSFSSTVSASGDGATVTVTIPVLEPLKKDVTRPVVTPPVEPRKQPPPSTAPEAKKSGRKTIGLVIAAVGLVGVAGG